MFREYTREEYLERIAWMKAAKREISITTDTITGFPGETEEDFRETLALLTEVGYDGVFAFKYSPRPNTPALQYADSIPDDEKSRRLQILMEHQREIQRVSYRRHVGQVIEVMVEGKNTARGQMIGRTSQNKTLNFVLNGRARAANRRVRLGAGHPGLPQQPARRAGDRIALFGVEVLRALRVSVVNDLFCKCLCVIRGRVLPHLRNPRPLAYH